MAERAIVTGGAGFIGLSLCRRLLADGYEVLVLDNLSRHGMDPEFGELSQDIEFRDRDISSGLPGTITRSCALVLHLAAWVGVGRVSSQPYRVLRDNIAATVSVLDWCASHEVGAVFLSSTSEVADGAAALGLTSLPDQDGMPFALPRPYAPRSSYALSKMVAETLLMSADGNFRVRIGRYYNVYGPRMGTEHVIPQFIGRVLAGTNPFPVFGGDHSRSFCYVSDAVEATMRLLALPAQQPVVADIGNDQEEISMRELARRLFAVAGFSAALDVRDGPPGSPLRRRPDLRLVRELTGYEPQVTLNDGLARTYSWYASRAAGSRA